MRRLPEETVRPSRTQRKLAAEAVTELAHRLTELPDATFKRLPLSDELRAEFSQVRKMKASAARERQLRHLGSELREDEELLARLKETLAGHDQKSRDEARLLHQFETWRTRLVDEALHAVTLNEVCAALPGLDRKALLDLIERYVQRCDKAAYRGIFRLLQEAERKGAG